MTIRRRADGPVLVTWSTPWPSVYGQRVEIAWPGATAAVDKALRLDTNVMLVDDPVKRVDNMTMAWGLEARVPFLDKEFLDVAMRLDPAAKMITEGRIEKHVLREAFGDLLPDGQHRIE